MSCNATFTHINTSNFGDAKKVTEELLKMYCQNDEYLYNQIRKLLDLSDPESRKRFYPPYYDDELKSFGHVSGTHDNKNCYLFHDAGEHVYNVNFKSSDDGRVMIDNIVFDRDESIIDYDRTGDDINIFVDPVTGIGHATIAEVVEEVQEPHQVTVFKDSTVTTTEKTTVTKTTDVASGKAKLDSFCRGPYGAMAPNGWWYVGWVKEKNYSPKSAWKKAPYTKGIPALCRAQTFTARTTGWVTKVNLNLKAESTRRSVSPFSCEIWKCDKNGKPTGNALARVEKRFNHTSGRIESFVFKKKVKLTKGHKYAIVMRSPLSTRDACYRTTGWPRTCYTNYKKGTYYYGDAYVSKDNGKSWIKYDKKAYGVLNSNVATTPIAFGFELYIQPTKPKTSKQTVTQEVQSITSVPEEETEYTMVEHHYYPVGNHYIYFNIPSSEPIKFLHINNAESELDGQKILFDISYDGKEFSTENLISDTTTGEGTYDLSEDKPCFVTVRCNLQNNSEIKTPDLQCVEFRVDTVAAKKMYIRTKPYYPESEQMLPACIWSEVNTSFDISNNVSGGVDIVREVEAQQRFIFKNDSVSDLGEYYEEYDPSFNLTDINDESFQELIQEDTDFIEYCKTLEPPIYVLSMYPKTDERYYEYFTELDLPDYPAYPILGCKKLLGDIKIFPEDFTDDIYNSQNDTATIKTNYNLNSDLVNILFQQPEDNQEGMVETILQENVDYRLDENNIVFLLNGTNINKHLNKKANGNIKNFKLNDGSNDLDENGEIINTIELLVNLQDGTYTEHMNYDIDYTNKKLIMKDSMRDNLSPGELLLSYNPLWVRDLQKDDFPLKMDLWTETFTAEENQQDYTTRVAPRDNLREVVLYDDEDSENRIELEEDVDFEVNYQKNLIHFNQALSEGTPVTIRYTPNLTDTGLSLAYRFDREDENSNIYIYNNHFTTRT